MRRNKGILRLTLVALIIGLTSFSTAVCSTAINTPSYAMAQTYTDFDEIKAGLERAYNIEDAINVIEKSKFRTLTDDNVYDLLTITYDKPKWLEPVNGKRIQSLQLLIAKKGNWIGRFGEEKDRYDLTTHKQMAYLSYIWPPNNGFVKGTEHALVLKEGDLLDRYGQPWGSYLSPKEKNKKVAYKERALKPGTDITSTYHVYEVKKEFIVQAGTVQPWFGVEGKGEQYYLDELNVKAYLDNGFLVEVIADEGK